MQLRDFQQDAVSAVLHALRGGGSTLLVMATGLGKTVVIAEVLRTYLQQGTGRRALVLAHREELVHQAAQKIRDIANCDVDVEMADSRARDDVYYRAPVIVSSVQTQVAGRGGKRRMMRFNAEQFGIVVIDEAHHATSQSYREVLQYYSHGRCRVLGVTATPDRHDEQALGQIFQSVAFTYDIREGIENGWLVPIRQRLVSVTGLDYSAVRTTAGDLNGADLDVVMQYEENLHGMVYPTLDISGDRRGIIFASSVSHADRIAEIINRHRPASAFLVSAKTQRDERRELLRDFSSGRYQWMVNVGIATEGWDDAALDGRGVQVISMMRPTRSRALYSQMIGRGTRPLPGTVDGLETASDRRAAIERSAKSGLLVLDFSGNAGRHRLVHCTDALAGKVSDGVVERAEHLCAEQAQSAEVDVLEVLTRAEVQQAREEEQRTRRGYVVSARYREQGIDPFSLIDLAPDRNLNANGVPASEKQLAMLRRLRVNIPLNLGRREASRLIDAALATPTPAQAFVLRRAGLDPSDYTRRTASAAIDEIKQRSIAT